MTRERQTPQPTIEMELATLDPARFRSKLAQLAARRALAERDRGLTARARDFLAQAREIERSIAR